jgi:putative nucleotidyltransferase with HDIG domain
MISIRLRILLLLTILLLSSGIGIVIFQHCESYRIQKMSLELVKDHAAQAQKILYYRQHILTTSVSGYANWEEMKTYLASPNHAWANKNLAGLLPLIHADGIWIYNAKKKLLFGRNIQNDPELNNPPFSTESLANSMSHPGVSHFFLQTSKGLFEVSGAAINHKQNGRIPSSPYGYIFIGRMWSSAFLNDLSKAGGWTISLLPASQRAQPPYSYSIPYGQIAFRLPLTGLNGQPIEYAYFSSSIPLAQNIYLAYMRVNVLYILCSIFFFVLIATCLGLWVSYPLRTITSSLRDENPDAMKDVIQCKGEMGTIARMISSAFQQKKELQEEISKRITMEDELRKIHEQLEGRVEERTAQLAETNTALEYKIKQHEEAENNIRILFMQQERRLHHMDALREIDTAIASKTDIAKILEMVLDHVIKQLCVDAAGIMKLEEDTQSLHYVAAKGFRTDITTQLLRREGEGHSSRAVFEKIPVRVPNLAQDPMTPIQSPYVHKERFISYYAVPLIASGKVYGVIEAFTRNNMDISTEWMDYFQTIAGQCAIALDSARIMDELKQANYDILEAYDATIAGWSRALELRDQETEGHSHRVTEMTYQLAKQMGFNQEDLLNARRGALLHDIGKMGIPDSILLKPGKLTDDEWVVMRMHTTYAYEMLAPISFLKNAVDIPWCHHEKWDGTGYPRGLKGEEIPLSARIFAVVDIWDALCSDRPYRKGWPTDKVIEYILSLSGNHLDPQVVDAFVALLEIEQQLPKAA